MLNATKKKKLCLQCQACCRLVYIPTKLPDKRDEPFYKARGIKFIKVKGTLHAAIPSRCPNLTVAGCAIYNNRPDACKDYDGREDPLLKDICLWRVSNQG